METILFNCQPNAQAPDWKLFDALEIGGCINDAKDGDEETNIIGGIEREQAEFFTIYGHLIEGGVEAITDVKTYKGAENIATLFALQTGFVIHVHC